MKRQTLILTTSTGAAVDVPCPAGKQIRIVAVRFTVTPTPGQLEQALVNFTRGGTTIVSAASPPSGDNIASAQAAIGSTIAPLLETAAFTYTGNATVLPFALPDITWPFEIRVTIGFSLTAPVNGMTLVYELDDL